MTETKLEFALRGPGGEPVDLRRTFSSHGLVELPPMHVSEDGNVFEATLPLKKVRPRTVTVTTGRRGRGTIDIRGRPLGDRGRGEVLGWVSYVLRLDEDLSEFYSLIADDPDLAWTARGAGRIIRSPTAFEDVVKTVCTTNCSWAATTKMVGALVEHLGEPVAGAPRAGSNGKAFPTATAMADVDESFYREVVRAGYRGPYLRTLATAVADGSVDLEELVRVPRDELPDDEVALRLQALPGVGPYAAAHIMMMLGRYSLLILDSWTRPKYARLMGRKKVADATIVRRFRRYGPWAGLAFWLFLTRDWIEDDAVSIR